MNLSVFEAFQFETKVESIMNENNQFELYILKILMNYL